MVVDATAVMTKVPLRLANGLGRFCTRTRLPTSIVWVPIVSVATLEASAAVVIVKT